MKCRWLWLLPAVLGAGEERYARVGEVTGTVEVQMTAAENWQPALRNAPLLDAAWVRTGTGSRVEIELDDGSVLRLGPDSLCELSDYTRLSTGQRVTLVSLDRGLAYLTGSPEPKDTLALVIPGVHVGIRQGARVRVEAGEALSQVAAIEGVVRFSTPTAEIDLREGQSVRVEPSNPDRFHLFREITPLDQDSWNAARDKVQASTTSGNHLAGLKSGLVDLDAAGTWIQTSAFGTVWKPNAPAGWVPFRNGKWIWYDELGYTWISGDPWGWLPYHYGRWMQQETVGWFWAPGKDATFTPGDVYWLRGGGLAGWGPLAPGETWQPGSTPHLYLNVHTTYAKFAAGDEQIDPATFTARPKEPLATVSFVTALPSPARLASRFEAKRPVLRAGSTRVTPHVPGISYEPAGEVARGVPPAPVAAVPSSPPAPETVAIPPEPQQPLVVTLPQPEPPTEVYYPAPVYTGIVVINPQERPHQQRKPRPAKPAPEPPPVVVSPPPAAAPAAPAALGMVRSERAQQQVRRNPEPVGTAPPAPEPQKPISRQAEELRPHRSRDR